MSWELWPHLGLSLRLGMWPQLGLQLGLKLSLGLNLRLNLLKPEAQYDTRPLNLRLQV